MIFDEKAKNWDTDMRISRAKIIAEEIKKSLSLANNLSAMEFGCGTGLISFNLLDKFKSIVLVDSSKGMIDIVNSKIEQNTLNTVISKNIDICKDDTLNQKFDVIYTSMVIHHIKDTEDIIKKLYKMLNASGYLIIIHLNEEDGSFHKNEPGFDGHNGFNQLELISLLEDAGFSKAKSHTFFFDKKEINGEEVDYSLFLALGNKD